MPTNRNNIEIGKTFDIGTKIEYMNKLFEVTESNQCCDCSLATICSSSDIYANDINDDVLSRDKRISIFGECSSIVRSDSKSVVFKEIPKTKEQDVYNDDTLYKINNELMPIQIDLPDGCIIDKDNSDFDKGIIAFKNKWLTLEQLYKLAKENNIVTHRDSIKNFSDSKLIALANLMDIASYFNGGWEYDVNQDVVGYLISYDRFVKEPCYNIRKNDSTTDVYYGNPVFKNEADAKYVIDNPNFRDILDTIFKV